MISARPKNSNKKRWCPFVLYCVFRSSVSEADKVGKKEILCNLFIGTDATG